MMTQLDGALGFVCPPGRVEEVRKVIGEITPPAKLVVQLLYGSGLRLLEALSLRVKDVDFARGQLTVRDPKWKHDRTTMLPSGLTGDARADRPLSVAAL